MVPSKGYVCRLCNCFLLDQQRVSIHCQTAAHYINYTTMAKMKEATSGGKKRGIEQVLEDQVVTGDDSVKENENDDVAIKKDVETQEAEVNSEVYNYSE